MNSFRDGPASQGHNRQLIRDSRLACGNLSKSDMEHLFGQLCSLGWRRRAKTALLSSTNQSYNPRDEHPNSCRVPDWVLGANCY